MVASMDRVTHCMGVMRTKATQAVARRYTRIGLIDTKLAQRTILLQNFKIKNKYNKNNKIMHYIMYVYVYVLVCVKLHEQPRATTTETKAKQHGVDKCMPEHYFQKFRHFEINFFIFFLFFFCLYIYFYNFFFYF